MDSALAELAASRGLGENVVFAGERDRASCLFLVDKADVHVLTSKSESFPNVVVEAQALSRPVVSFDVGAASEIIKDGVTGYITAVGDPNAFVERTAELLKNRALGREMGALGKERIFTCFSMKRKVDNFTSMVWKDLSIVESCA